KNAIAPAIAARWMPQNAAELGLKLRSSEREPGTAVALAPSPSPEASGDCDEAAGISDDLRRATSSTTGALVVAGFLEAATRVWRNVCALRPGKHDGQLQTSTVPQSSSPARIAPPLGVNASDAMLF